MDTILIEWKMDVVKILYLIGVLQLPKYTLHFLPKSGAVVHHFLLLDDRIIPRDFSFSL